MEAGTVEIVRRMLVEALAPIALEIIDDTAAHGRHAGMRGGNASHLLVSIVSGAFVGKSRLARHQMINAVLQPLFASGALHACAMTALAPGEGAIA